MIGNKSGTWTEFWAWLALLFAVSVAGAVLGARINRDVMRQDAVRAGVGHFVIADTNSGTSAFEWITNRVDSGK